MIFPNNVLIVHQATLEQLEPLRRMLLNNKYKNWRYWLEIMNIAAASNSYNKQVGKDTAHWVKQ